MFHTHFIMSIHDHYNDITEQGGTYIGSVVWLLDNTEPVTFNGITHTPIVLIKDLERQSIDSDDIQIESDAFELGGVIIYVQRLLDYSDPMDCAYEIVKRFLVKSDDRWISYESLHALCRERFNVTYEDYLDSPNFKVVLPQRDDSPCDRNVQ